MEQIPSFYVRPPPLVPKSFYPVFFCRLLSPCIDLGKYQVVSYHITDNCLLNIQFIRQLQEMMSINEMRHEDIAIHGFYIIVN